MAVYYTTTNHLTGQTHTRKSAKHLFPHYTHAVWIKDCRGDYYCRGFAGSIETAEYRAKVLAGDNWPAVTVIEPCGARVALTKADREVMTKRGSIFA